MKVNKDLIAFDFKTPLTVMEDNTYKRRRFLEIWFGKSCWFSHG